MNQLLAKEMHLDPLGDLNTQSGLGPFSDLGQAPISAVGVKLSGMISNVLAVITVSAGVWFLIQFAIGAVKWISSGGDKGNVEQAKEHLTHAVVALGIIVASYVIAGVVGAVLGLDILNPQKILPLLKP